MEYRVLATIPALHARGNPCSVPVVIADAGERAALRFVEFFTVNIRNVNTRAPYGRAVRGFFAWCENTTSPLGGPNQKAHAAHAVVDRRQGQKPSQPSMFTSGTSPREPRRSSP